MEFAQAYFAADDDDDSAWEENRIRSSYGQGSTEAERGELHPDESASFRMYSAAWWHSGLLASDYGSFYGVETSPEIELRKTRLIGKPLETPAKPEKRQHTPCVFVDGKCKYALSHGHPTIESVEASGTSVIEGGISSLPEVRKAYALKHRWKFGLVVYILHRWYAENARTQKDGTQVEAAKSLVYRDDSPFCRRSTERREKKRADFMASKYWYPLTERPEWQRPLLLLKDIRKPAEYRNASVKEHKVDILLNRWLRDLENGHKHTRAGHKAYKLTHECHRNCTCWMDWRPFVTWRPWQDPPARAIEEMRVNTIGRIKQGTELYRILEAFKSSAPEAPYREPHLQWYAKRSDGDYVFTVRPRMRLNAWINGKPVEPLFVKLWECFWFGKVEVDWTLVRYDTEPVHIPAFVGRVSAKEIIDRFGVSRATAFRYIQRGARTIEDVWVMIAAREEYEAQIAGR